MSFKIIKKRRSCWAFSAVASLEGQFYKYTNMQVKLSEQNLLDCSGQGCGGGMMSKAFDYIISNGGINDWNAYPVR